MALKANKAKKLDPAALKAVETKKRARLNIALDADLKKELQLVALHLDADVQDVVSAGIRLALAANEKGALEL